MRRYKTYLREHLAERLGSYLFVIVLFIVGVISGAISINTLSFAQKQELLVFLRHFFDAGIITSQGAFWETLRLNLQLGASIWLLGLLVFGLPVVVVLTYMRGFVLGFSVGFLLNQMGGKGLVFAFASVVPHNLISVPVALVLSAISISYSLDVFRPRRGLPKPRSNFWQRAAEYSVLALILLVGLILASVIEAFVTPVFVHLVSRWF